MFKVVIEIGEGQGVLLRDPLYEKAEGPSEVEQIASVIDTFGRPRLFKVVDLAHKEISESQLDLVPVQRSHLLFLIGVPSTIHYQELLGPYLEVIAYSRILHFYESCYSLILSFKDQHSADRFYVEFSGKQFDFQEQCYVVYLSELLFAWTVTTDSSLLELPVCPVCLERLDCGVTSLKVVIAPKDLCQGTRWRALREECVVCSTLTRKDSAEVGCVECGDTESLWICLICGYLACGRYREAHSKLHAFLSKHNFTVDMDSGRIWDYVADMYAHRVAQEFPDLHPIHQSPSKDINDIVWEYEYLINSQLETQREALEQTLNEKLSQVNSQTNLKIKNARGENEKLRRLVAKLKAKERKKKGLLDKLEQLKEENAFQHELNEGLKHQPKSDEPLFESKADKRAYLTLGRLRAELQEKLAKLG